MFSFLNRFLELIPLGTSILLIIIFSINDGGLLSYDFTPALGAICVFYWFFTSRWLVGTLTIFLIGLFADIVSLTPYGIQSVALLLAYYITKEQRELCTKYGFLAFWLFFGYFLAIFFLVKAVMTAIYFTSISFTYSFIAQYLYTFFLYPIIHFLLSFISLKKIVLIRF